VFELQVMWCAESMKRTLIILYVCLTNTSCGCEVPRMILLQASYRYTYRFLKGVTFKVLPLSTYALIPMMLQLLETFLELLCGIAFTAIFTFFFFLDVFFILKSSSH